MKIKLNKKKKKQLMYTLVIIGVLIGILYFSGNLPFTVSPPPGGHFDAGTTTISGYDGRYIIIPANFIASGDDSFFMSLLGTNNLNESICRKIGWEWNSGATYKCIPTDGLKNFNWTYNPNPLDTCILKDGAGFDWRTYHPDNYISTINFVGAYIILYAPSGVKSVQCGVTILVDINPSSNEDVQNKITQNESKSYIIVIIALIIIGLTVLYKKIK